jgi:hypothetical protein
LALGEQGRIAQGHMLNKREQGRRNEHGQSRRNTQSKRVGAWLAASGHMGTRQGPSMNKHSKEVRNVAHANTDTAR